MLRGTKVKPSTVHGCGLFATQRFQDGVIIGAVRGTFVDACKVTEGQRSNSFPPPHTHTRYPTQGWPSIIAATLPHRHCLQVKTMVAFLNHFPDINISKIKDLEEQQAKEVLESLLEEQQAAKRVKIEPGMENLAITNGTGTGSNGNSNNDDADMNEETAAEEEPTPATPATKGKGKGRTK